MNRDDIIRMAREAGLLGTGKSASKHINEVKEEITDDCVRFAALIAEPLQERIKDLYRQLDEAEKRLDQQYKMGMEYKLDECILILERLYERSGEQYKQYLHAARVLKGEA
jgi:hypothetical protein